MRESGEPEDAPRPRRSDEPRRPRDSIPHTVCLLIVAFVMAFVFRGFVVEPFVIPTGSMAPTLLGAHVLARSPYSGAAWPVAPRDYAADESTPLSVQGGPESRDGPLVAHDPMARLPITLDSPPLRAGDRILVQKYIYAVSEPRRWDVVVFRGAETPEENLIKRLVGLPDEELRIVAGDIFTARPWSTDAAERTWKIERKPRRVQERLWRSVYDSAFAPTVWTRAGRPWQGPWQGDGWTEEAGAYTAPNPGTNVLRWTPGQDPATGEPVWPIDDFEAYNETPRLAGSLKRFPVGDVRVRAVVEPVGEDLPGLTFRLEANGRSIAAHCAPGSVIVSVRPTEGTPDAAIETRAEAPRGLLPLRAGRPTSVEFWHWDQTIAVVIDGRRVCEMPYELDADERLRASSTVADPEARFDATEPRNFRATELSLITTGGPAKLHRVSVDRDIYYQPSERRRSFVLGDDEFLVLGDNSAASRDARAWTRVNAWVERATGSSPGVVPRELLMGKAFFVYFPAPFRGLGRLAIPDVGRARFIR